MTHRPITTRRGNRLDGAWVRTVDRALDERGWFGRLFEATSAEPDPTVCAVAFNPARGTLRGLHWQEAPHEETKLVSCLYGALYDVVVDLRAGSRTRGEWAAVELDAAAPAVLCVPPGCAHGYLTLRDDTLVLYRIEGAHVPEAARGARWDDPALAIVWPAPALVMGERDRTWPAWNPQVRP